MTNTEKVEAAIKEYAAPDDELGWMGAPEVDRLAYEIAAYLDEKGLLA